MTGRISLNRYVKPCASISATGYSLQPFPGISGWQRLRATENRSLSTTPDLAELRLTLNSPANIWRETESRAQKVLSVKLPPIRNQRPKFASGHIHDFG